MGTDHKIKSYGMQPYLWIMLSSLLSRSIF